MNARQAAKAAAARIEEMERVAALNKQDIIQYNKCILDMIAGESPCAYCEDWNECQLEEKSGKGCAEWMLRIWKAGEPDGTEGETEGDEDPVQRVEEQ